MEAIMVCYSLQKQILFPDSLPECKLWEMS